LVAERVRVESRVEGGGVNVWESGADGSFVIYEGDVENFGEERGTKISLILKDDSKEYLEQARLKELITKYSQFINFPIFLRTKTVVEVPVEKEERDKGGDEKEEREKGGDEKEDGDEKKADEDDEIKVEDEDEDEEKDDAPKTRTETTYTWELMNKNKPIWTRDPAMIDEGEYTRFYDGIARLPGSPMARSHFKGEGEVEFRSILYIPDKPPVGLYSGHGNDLEKDAIRLYVRRVLVTDTFEEGLLPRYLAFLVGIVDSDDLPINVSREMLQKSKTLDIIRRKLVRKALEMMKSLVKQDEEATEEKEEATEEKEEAGEGEKKEGEVKKEVASGAYMKFWKLYGKSIKLGVIEDSSNRARLAKLLRFQTSKSDLEDANDYRSLDQYLDGMKEDQDHIYYHSGETVADIKGSPFLEKLLAKGYEVLYLTEPIDEHMIMNLPDYEGTKFMSVAKDGFKFGEKDQKEEKDKTNALKKQYRPLTKFLKKRLSERVSKVKLSSRLSDTPCVLSTEQYGYSARMEIVMKAQAFADPDSFSYMAPKTKIMELNPHHPLVRRMLDYVKEAEGKEGDEAKEAEERAEELGNLVYDTALISGGYLLHDTADFSKRMYKWISTSVGVDPNAEMDEVVPEPESEDSQEEKDPEEIFESMKDMPGMEGAKMYSREDIEKQMKDGKLNLGEESAGHDEL
jgi:heat shock protein 90kDa beta